MRILGIDPGLAITGIALIEADSPQKFTRTDWLTITTKSGLPLPDRLCELQHDLHEYLRDTKPQYAVVERLFFATNRLTAIAVAQARGVILLTLAEHAIPCLEPTPLELKHCITGDGNADKRQVQDMLTRTFSLQEPPKPDDAADALALALYGLLNAKLFAFENA
ncbi:crossover junction endodeoxyribonuclease RuvC [Candidatus Peregrinibacteria bacterium CG10_big_fil_rev_8_21_14_0_10_55_24]|nr:MAG: crossover junction endodeoxyribonuclease RuvC [Candidatus Peregrinibacteria bacterium CG10_big_fil_rev_8_21_14_0_10_55_24]